MPGDYKAKDQWINGDKARDEGMEKGGGEKRKGRRF